MQSVFSIRSQVKIGLSLTMIGISLHGAYAESFDIKVRKKAEIIGRTTMRTK